MLLLTHLRHNFLLFGGLHDLFYSDFSCRHTYDSTNRVAMKVNIICLHSHLMAMLRFRFVHELTHDIQVVLSVYL